MSETETYILPDAIPGGSPSAAIEQDIWSWLNAFVAVNNSFYAGKFPPCPYARRAIIAGQVDVKVYLKGDVRAFIREKTTAPGPGVRVEKDERRPPDPRIRIGSHSVNEPLSLSSASGSSIDERLRI